MKQRKAGGQALPHGVMMRSGFRMVVFSVVIMIIVLFFSKGIMGDKELTWEGIGGWLKKLKSKKKITEKEG